MKLSASGAINEADDKSERSSGCVLSSILDSRGGGEGAKN
jgi:hypothetical protein